MKRTASSGSSTARRGALGLCAIALSVLAMACANSRQPVSPSALSAGPAASEAPAVPRSVAGAVDGRFDFTHMWGSEWWQFYSDGDATGTLSHLGLARLQTRHIPNLVTGALEQGEFTIVAANGDEIRGTYEGSASYDPERADIAHGIATFVVTGGTGRFAGASGSLNVTFLETFDDPSWASAKVAWTINGTVNY